MTEPFAADSYSQAGAEPANISFATDPTAAAPNNLLPGKFSLMINSAKDVTVDVFNGTKQVTRSAAGETGTIVLTSPSGLDKYDCALRLVDLKKGDQIRVVVCEIVAAGTTGTGVSQAYTLSENCSPAKGTTKAKPAAKPAAKPIKKAKPAAKKVAKPKPKAKPAKVKAKPAKKKARR